MKVSQETAGTREVLLTIEPEPEVVERAMRKAGREISKYRPLRGYRPGKAPYAQVERAYGRDTILSEALRELGPQLYREAVTQAAIEPYAEGQLDIKSQEPLVLAATVPLMPEVKLGDYKSLKVEQEPAVAVSEEQIAEQLERVRQAHAEHETVERPAQMGDQLVADVTGVADGETVVDRHGSTLDLTDALEPAGFGEALVGMSAGEARTFALTYPEDYADDDLAGKNVEFTVTVTTVRETRLPALDDDLAKMAGDYETLDQVRDVLADNLRQRLESEARRRETDAVVAAITEQAEIVYPEAALENEISMAINRQKNQLQQMGFGFENYLRMVGKTEAELREDARSGAERSLRQRLAVLELARAEELQVTPDELGAELQQLQANISATYGERAPQVLRDLQQQGIAYQLYNDALVDKALRHARALLTGRPEELQYTLEPVAADVETEVAEMPEVAQPDSAAEPSQAEE